MALHAQLRGVRQGTLLVGGVYLLSPLIKTLAATVSADSIVALTSVLLLAHLFLHDYRWGGRRACARARMWCV